MNHEHHVISEFHHTAVAGPPLMDVTEVTHHRAASRSQLDLHMQCTV